jgi:hypothetical protein
MHLCRQLLLLGLAALGCAPSSLTAPPPEAGGRANLFGGPQVHVENADPSRPLALYRIESDTAVQYASAPRRSGGPRGGDTSDEVENVTVDRVICLAPCDQRVGSAWDVEFFLGGDGIPPSSRFHLAPSVQSVSITALPGSLVRTRLGIAGIAVGSVSLSVATIVLLLAAPNRDSTITGVGVGLIGGGVLLLGAGIPLLVTGKTTFSFAPPDPVVRF